MKVLVICQHYWPENFRVTEICENLVRRGHQVTALVGLPNYPSGIVPKEYRHFRNRRQQRNGVEIRRCFEIGRRPGKAGLAVNYVSFMVSACFHALLLKRDYDVVYAYSTSPVLMSLPAALLRCFSPKKLMIYVLDIWPACLAAMNVPESHLLYRFMKRVSKWVYGKADLLVYSSKRFQGYLKTVHGIEVNDEQYMPQFADDIFQKPLPAKPRENTVNLVFAGNIGKVQAVEVLMQAVRRYQDTTGRRVSFEYSMVRGVNDSDACAKQLANLIRGMGAHVNLIPINPVDGSPYSATDAANVRRFQQKLESLGVNATVRRRLGSEISAACGQLRRDEMNGKA